MVERPQLSVDQLVAALQFSRKYLENLLEEVADEDWFRIPPGARTHIGWQVGHVTWAQWRLVFGRVFKERPDYGLIPESFGDLFGIRSEPLSNPGAYPFPAELREVMSDLHNSVIAAVNSIDQQQLEEPSEPAHLCFTDKGGAIRWAADHELIHIGQIALLKRQLGYSPLR